MPPITGPIVETLQANRSIVPRLRRSTSGDGLVASVCTGAFFLAEAGMLASCRATTNPLLADTFRQTYSNVTLVPEERLVDEGRVLCAGSTTAFLDLAIYLVDRIAGHEIAVLTAKSLCVDMSHRSQIPYFVYVAPKNHGDGAVLSLQQWMELQHGEAITSDHLARRGAMSSAA